MFLKNDIIFFDAMKEFFDLYYLISNSLKEKDIMIPGPQTNANNVRMIIEEVKTEGVIMNKSQLEKSKLSKEITKNTHNLRNVESRQTLHTTYNVNENDYFESIPNVFNSFIKPFRNIFASLNAGVLTLYEVLHKDRDAILEDLKLFVIFLEIYGTGRALRPNGEYVLLRQRRKNSCKKVDCIISDLEEIIKTDIQVHTKNPEIYKRARELADIIIEGFKALKVHLEYKLEFDGLNESSQKENHFQRR